jgi:hypothetical protein
MRSSPEPMLHSPQSARFLPNQHRMRRFFPHSADADLSVSPFAPLAAPCWATPEEAHRGLSPAQQTQQFKQSA